MISNLASNTRAAARLAAPAFAWGDAAHECAWSRRRGIATTVRL